MGNVYDILVERGYIKQLTHQEEIKELLNNEKITFYIGFDPTADSLHIGHFLPLMMMAHMQRAGHRPIALVGGGTVMIGDPSGKTDMRKMLDKETIEKNVACIKNQLSRFIDFDDGKAILANNSDWLSKLNYIEFIRDIGVHFSVNKMLTAECFKQRLEKGLSFLEFNYMLMQGYDFLELNRRYGCIMELGGDDQWSNMIAGMELIRKKSSKQVYAMTCTLLTNSEGQKMGKTAKGALWLDPEKTSPYEFYQYWRNVDDADVDQCLRLLTFIPMEKIRELNKLEGAVNAPNSTFFAPQDYSIHNYFKLKYPDPTKRPKTFDAIPTADMEEIAAIIKNYIVPQSKILRTALSSQYTFGTSAGNQKVRFNLVKEDYLGNVNMGAAYIMFSLDVKPNASTPQFQSVKVVVSDIETNTGVVQTLNTDAHVFGFK